MKGYLSIREAAEKWGVSERRVNQYCAEGLKSYGQSPILAFGNSIALGFPSLESLSCLLYTSAAYHVFHRLLVPRHPPCALIA